MHVEKHHSHGQRFILELASLKKNTLLQAPHHTNMIGARDVGLARLWIDPGPIQLSEIRADAGCEGGIKVRPKKAA